jgi:hypothetical protein
MKHVAFVTYQSHPALSASDALVVEPLRARGVTVQAVAWDTAVDWRQFDGVVLRSNWDYQQRPEEFRVWVTQLKRQRINLWNPPDVVLWNMDKIYLRALQADGVAIGPTVWLNQGQQANLAAILSQQGWEQAVVKPRIGASARHIWLTSCAEALAHQCQLDAGLEQQGWMVQKLLPQIATGEWSLIFFRHAFAYAVLKKPEPGNIFVQQRLGGGWTHQYPAPSLIAQARYALEVTQRLTGMQEPLLYARVDGIVIDGVLHLMELEVNEPGLMLDADAPRGPERFAEAIVQVIDQP